MKKKPEPSDIFTTEGLRFLDEKLKPRIKPRNQLRPPEERKMRVRWTQTYRDEMLYLYGEHDE